MATQSTASNQPDAARQFLRWVLIPLGCLATMFIYLWISKGNKDVQKAHNEIESIIRQAEIYQQSEGEWPDSIHALLHNHNWNVKDFAEARRGTLDPWGTTYFFEAKGRPQVLEVRSAGPDRKFWTSDDISSRSYLRLTASPKARESESKRRESNPPASTPSEGIQGGYR